ncbi:adenosylcobinamide-GDP ribazoletransferase [Actinomadura scrupuli]|uniref:adenosylcobinamide-GDP ribazoletransferase n=1 Tax=Actinomadura scrupuli TaxID=559629 RepID=UPI003D98A5CA
MRHPLTAGPRLAITLLTVLPLRAGPVDRTTAGRAMTLAPAAGLVVGAVAAAVLATGDGAGLGHPTAAALAMASAAVMTRALHLDGLADVADGLGSARPAPEALAIMKRSDIGPFGVVTLVFTLLVQVGALAQATGRGHGALAVVIAAVTGRLAVTWACRQGVPAARPDGLGALVAGSVRTPAAVVVTALVLAAAALGGAASAGPRGAVLAALSVLAGLAVAAGARWHTTRRLGGVTGDVLGALVELGATAALIVLAVL